MFVRSAIRPARHFTAQTRRWASTSPPKSGTLPYVLLTFGAACGGLVYYMEYMEEHYKQEKSPLDPDNFVDFKLKKVIPYNHNTSEFIFELPKNEASLLPVASCVIVKASDPEALKDAKGKPIIRPYTPISPPEKKGELTFLIKKYEEGNASKHIHSLQPGQTLAMKGPFVKFQYKANEFDEITLIGGGSGITPLYQVVNHALPNPENKTKFTLVFSNATEKDILMKNELDGLAKKYPSTFKVIYTVDKPETDSWAGPTGFVTKDFLQANIAPASLGEKTKVMVCGPLGQMAAVSGKKAGMKQGELGGILKDLGYTSEQVFKF
ncbi:cytochrome-b5 reductase [Flagelloscypha sp. PMI_526]|nr:cytochrome-b5 reductase [Flagelloscypha sp. PMI_526]